MNFFTSPRRAAAAKLDMENEESPKPNTGENEESLESPKDEVKVDEQDEHKSRLESPGKNRKDDDEWAPNLFYAYASRTDDPKGTRYLLTFSTAQVSNEWWSLIQREYGRAPFNIRESSQLFSFQGDDLPGKAWKNTKFQHLKTKWFYTYLGDAVGSSGRGHEVIPLQDEKGWVVGYKKQIEVRGKSPVSQISIPSPTPSTFERPQSISDAAPEERWKERRRSKRDSGIMMFASNFAERRDSIDATHDHLQSSKPKFDFDRMERNLEKVERLMEQNAQQMRSLEHVQAANMERLTSALVQNVEMVRELTVGQGNLSDMVEELRRGFVDRDEKGTSASGSVRDTNPSLVGEHCRHVVHVGRKPPRKIGRTVIGYVYAEDGKCVRN